MNVPDPDTIFALASGQARAGVSVFRVSGPKARSLLQSLTQNKVPAPRRAALRRLFGPMDTPIDEALVLWMPSPGSFTGEDVAEFHTHGSPAVTDLMGEALLAYGARQAGPGEFTRRAFDNGRMDLTEAEGLADLIDAETVGQHRQALRQMQGGLKETYETWRSHLIDGLAAIEGEIDFPDEADVPDALSHKAYAPLGAAFDGMRQVLSSADRGERIRAGLDIAIIGPPNAGKSTLLNRLAGRDAAIVSAKAGTTRDIVDVHMVMGGLPIRLSDTAGMRDTEDDIEAEGVSRARTRAEDSDIRIAVFDTADPSPVSEIDHALKDGDFILMNKTDKTTDEQSLQRHSKACDIFAISAATGAGVDAFQAALERAIIERFPVSQTAGLTRARHKDCVKRAMEAIQRAQTHLGSSPELSGDDVRAALHAIRELAGEADIEAVLDRIFSRFCIGK